MSEDLFDYVNVKHTATTYSSTVHVNQGADKYIWQEVSQLRWARGAMPTERQNDGSLERGLEDLKHIMCGKWCTPRASEGQTNN